MVEFQSRILGIVDYPVAEGAATRVFECELPSSVSMPYLSGQFAMISHPDVKLLGNPSALKWASYSISSSPLLKDRLEFCIGGGSPEGVSHRLMSLKEGDTISVRGAFGKFILDENAPEYVFLATGTGIAPLISMIRTLLGKGVRVPISLYFGFRFPSQYMYREELENLVHAHPNFRVFITASRPDGDWPHLSGHIQDSLKGYSSPSKDQAKVYICGKPAIAEELVKFCIDGIRFPLENVIIEKW